MAEVQGSGLSARRGLRIYVDLLAPQRKMLLLALATAALKSLAEAPAPRAVGFIVDKVSAADFAWFEANQTRLLVGLAAFLAVYLPVSYWRSMSSSLIALKAFFTLRTQLFNHIQGLSADFYVRNKTGDLTSRLISDIQTVSVTVVSVLTRIAFDVFLFVPSLCFMVTASGTMSLVVIGFAGLQLLCTHRMMPEMKRQSRLISQKLGEISSDAAEKIEGHALVRSSAEEQQVVARFQALNAQHLSMTIRLRRYAILRQTFIHALDPIFAALVAFIGYLLARAGKVTVGEAVAVVVYIPIVHGAVFRFAEALSQWAEAMGCLARIQEIFATLPTVKDKPAAVRLERPKGRIVFRDVSFSYPSAGPDGRSVKVFEGFNLDIRPGEVLAVVGPSGSGKTTLTQLLLRFYDVSAGAIEIDGHDIRDVTQASLRRSIGVVMQRPIIFSGSILDNLRFVRPDATVEQVRQALRYAALEQFVSSLPAGLDMQIGERGVTLSGGQQQRLTIARIFLKDPAILVLDEATSSLDARSEALIQSALEKLMVGRTTLVIAHRLSTVRNADRIVVLLDGRIAESGRHEELMARQGAYFDLVKAQTELFVPYE